MVRGWRSRLLLSGVSPGSLSEIKMWAGRVQWALFCGAVSMACVTPAAAQRVWEVTPRISVGAEASDNVAFASRGEERSDLSAHLRPGIALRRDGPRLDLNLNYTMDRSYHRQHSGFDRSTHRLRGQGVWEMVDESAFVEGSVRRQLYRDEPFQARRIADRPEMTHIRLSPYWIARYGTFAEQRMRYIYEQVRYHSSARQPAHVQRLNYLLSSGSAFNRPFWNLRATGNENRYDDSQRQPVSRIDAGATAGYRFGRALRLSASAGAGEYRVGEREWQDSSNWSINAGWAPGSNTQLSGSWGKSNMEVRDRETRREQRSLEVSHQTARMNYALSYREQMSDFGIDPGQQDVLDLLDEIRQAGADIPALRIDDRVAFTETWRARWSYSRAFDTFRLVFRQREVDRSRILSDPDAEEVDLVRGVDASWSRQLGARSDIQLRGGYDRHAALSGAGDRRDEWRAALRLSRDIGRRSSARVEYSHRFSRREPPQAEEVERRENRLAIYFTMTL